VGSREEAKEERKDRIAGRGLMAGKSRVAAPLLGGVRGWVYLQAASNRRISAWKNLRVKSQILPFDEFFMQ
jgi:hypothetical protein